MSRFVSESYLLCVAEKHFSKAFKEMKSTDTAVETRCSVCNQGFVMFWERQTKMERAEALREIEATLRHHHHVGAGPQVHPEKGFLVPAWDGPIAFSGAAILGNAPVWAL
jgi:hypothetical protein